MQERIIPPRYLEPHQARTAPPTPYEDQLADSIERAYAQGIHALDDLLSCLNQSGPLGPNGQPWTAKTFVEQLDRLGA